MWNKMVENDLYLKLGEDLLEIVCGVALDLGGDIRRARSKSTTYFHLLLLLLPFLLHHHHPHHLVIMILINIGCRACTHNQDPIPDIHILQSRLNPTTLQTGCLTRAQTRLLGDFTTSRPMNLLLSRASSSSSNASARILSWKQ
jgi:hypothetical protein